MNENNLMKEKAKKKVKRPNKKKNIVSKDSP